MNSLSWLIYLADVADNLDWFFFIVMLLSILGGIIWLIVGLGMADTGAGSDDWRTWRKSGLLLIPLFFFGVVLGSIVPGKETVYAIAASEMGERAMNTQTFGKATQALNRWLDKQIQPEKESE